jgi:hypothetical protein
MFHNTDNSTPVGGPIESLQITDESGNEPVDESFAFPTDLFIDIIEKVASKGCLWNTHASLKS